MIAWAASAARAEAPVIVSEDGGQVRASVVVSAPIDQVLALVRNPSATAALTSDGEFSIAPSDDGCYRVGFTLDSWFAAIAYNARTCPTPTGMRAELVDSDTFRALRSEWHVRAIPTGTEVSYWVEAELNLPIPAWVVRRMTRSEITTVLDRLATQLGE